MYKKETRKTNLERMKKDEKKARGKKVVKRDTLVRRKDPKRNWKRLWRPAVAPQVEVPNSNKLSR